MIVLLVKKYGNSKQHLDVLYRKSKFLQYFNIFHTALTHWHFKLCISMRSIFRSDWNILKQITVCRLIILYTWLHTRGQNHVFGLNCNTKLSITEIFNSPNVKNSLHDCRASAIVENCLIRTHDIQSKIYSYANFMIYDVNQCHTLLLWKPFTMA